MSSWINKKLMTFSEKVIENVIDSFANKNASIDNIQNIQSSQLGKIISKVISSKYFFKNDDISYNATKLDFDWFGKDKKKRKKKKKKKTYIDGHILNGRDKKKKNGNTEKEYEENYSDENEVDSIDFSVEKSNLSPSCYSRRNKKRKTKAKKEITKKTAEETGGKQKKKTENGTENDSTIKYSIFSRNVLSVSSDDKESTAQIPSNGSGVVAALSDGIVDKYVPFGSTSNTSRNSGETEDSNSEEDSEEDSEETDSEYSTDYSHDWRSGQTSENDSFASSSTLEEMELPPRYNIFNTDGAENDVERKKETEQEKEKEKEKDNAKREAQTISSKLNWQVVKDERRKTGRSGNSEVSEINRETCFFRRERNLCKINLLIKEAKLLFFNKNVNVSDISIYVTTILEDRKYVGKLKRLSSRTLPINNLSINEHICHNIRDIFTDIVINIKYKCKKNEKEDVIVGRVIIPLFLLLNTFPCKVKKIKNKLKYYTKCYLWLHIFPSNNKLFNYKFFKPVEGFDEYGMLNPMYTLGFLNVKIKIIFKENPYFLTLFSNIRKPIFYYKLPRYFEPLYCHYYSSNFYLYLKHIPLWVYKFFYVFNWKRIEIVPLNFFDYIFILLFWTFLFRLFVFSPFYQILVHLFFCVLFVSLSYKYGLINYQRRMVYLFEPFKKSGKGRDLIYRKLQLLDQKDVCENTGTSFLGEKKNVHFYSRQKVALWDDNIDPNYYNCLNVEDKENEEKKKRENKKGKETNKGKEKDTFFGFGYCDGSKPAEILSNIMDYRNGFQGRDIMMTKEQNEKETMSIKVGDFEERVLNGDSHSTYTENNHIEAEHFIAKTDLNQKVNFLNSSADESNLDTSMDGREAKKEKSERLKGIQLKKKKTNITELAKRIQNIFDNNINNNMNHNNNNNNNIILNNNSNDNNNINNNINNNHNNNCNASNDNVSSYRGSVNSGAEVEGINTKKNYLKIPNKNNININRFMGLFHKKIENNPSEETDRESILSEKDRTVNEETEYIDPKRKDPFVNCNSGNEFEREKNERVELDTEVKRKQISGEFKTSKKDSERRRNERIFHGCDEIIFSSFRKNKRMKLPPFLLDYEMHNENILHVNSYNLSYLFGRNNDNKKLEKDTFRSELSNWNCVNPNGTLLSSHSLHSAHNETNGIKQKTAADMKKEKKLHPFVKSPFHNFRLFVNSVEKKDVSIFSNNVEVPNVQIILNRFITLVTFAQHLTGLFTMTYEKIKYAFNWSFDFYTTVNLLVLLFVCYSISVALYMLSFIPFVFYRVCMFFAFTYLSVKSYDLTEIGYNMNMYLKKRERRRRRKRRKGKCVKINKFYEIRNMGRILKNCLTIWLRSQLQPKRHVYRNILYQVYRVVQNVITVMYLLCLYLGRQLGVFVLFQILKKFIIRIFTFLKKTGRSIILYILFAIFFVKNWYTRLLILKDIDHMHIANLQAFKNLYFFIHRKIKKVEDAYKVGNKNSTFVCKGKHDVGGTAVVHRHNENVKGVDENKFASNRKNCLTFPVCENFKNLENCNFSSSEEDDMFSNKGRIENSYLSIEENEKDEKEDNSLCYITDNENMNVHVDIFLHYYFKKKKYDLFNNFININRNNMCT